MGAASSICCNNCLRSRSGASETSTLSSCSRSNTASASGIWRSPDRGACSRLTSSLLPRPAINSPSICALRKPRDWIASAISGVLSVHSNPLRDHSRTLPAVSVARMR
ncbi:hypothetical protein XOCgx_2823 [Xanthomonas oryzae pv. oryzicola]|nr:hypothetical protein XOCgx_2823 [Xanthomonas oryzae pv. oryzicola]